MQRLILKSKIHRATVTDSDLNYEGSITIDERLMNAADILPYEKVDIYNISNSERFSTYVIKGKKDSCAICINGAAARKCFKGDLIIIASYVIIDNDSAKDWSPKCVFVDEKNRVKDLSTNNLHILLVF